MKNTLQEWPKIYRNISVGSGTSQIRSVCSTGGVDSPVYLPPIVPTNPLAPTLRRAATLHGRMHPSSFQHLRRPTGQSATAYSPSNSSLNFKRVSRSIASRRLWNVPMTWCILTANSRVGNAALHYNRSNGGSSGDRNFKKGYISSGRSSSASSLPHHRKPCAFCVRTGRDKSMYDSHMLRNPITNHVMCPELKKYPL